MARILSASADGATVDFSATEIATLTDLLEQRLGYQESSGSLLDGDDRTEVEATYTEFKTALHAIWKSQAALRGPFSNGEPVWFEPDEADSVSAPQLATVIGLGEPSSKRSSTYLIRLADGRELPVAEHQLQRANGEKS
jgi:hypothetical protein